METTPVYSIEDFRSGASVFYANRLKPHVESHAFTNLPHKHDFYLVMLVTEGTGWHEIDFKRYEAKKGSIFLMQPGQVHYWKLSGNIDGYIFFHSRSFFDEAYTLNTVQDFPFFNSFRSRSGLLISKDTLRDLEKLMREIYSEFKAERVFKFQKLHSLVDLTYIDIARVYPSVVTGKNKKYQEKFQQFQRLLERHFKEQKLPGTYAGDLNISERHLSRIVQECTNENTSHFIAHRVILEAKRLLIRADMNINEIAEELGFSNASYFIRFFKKHVGQTPLSFLKRSEKRFL